MQSKKVFVRAERAIVVHLDDESTSIVPAGTQGRLVGAMGFDPEEEGVGVSPTLCVEWELFAEGPAKPGAKSKLRIESPDYHVSVPADSVRVVMVENGGE